MRDPATQYTVNTLVDFTVCAYACVCVCLIVTQNAAVSVPLDRTSLVRVTTLPTDCVQVCVRYF